MSDPRHGNSEPDPQPWQQQPGPFPGQPVYGQQPAQPGYGQYQDPPQYVAPPPRRPNHILHLILTVLTCGAWGSVWIVLAARYWGVVDYRNPAEHPGMQRRTWIAIGCVAAVSVGIAVIGSAGSGASTGTTATADTSVPSAASVATDEPSTTAAASKPKPAAKPKLTPAGVTASGGDADAIKIRTFKADRDYFGDFKVTLRLKNISGEDISFMSIKVTALRGEKIVATADDIVESIDAGQTITTEPISGDAFPRNRSGITYEIELE